MPNFEKPKEENPPVQPERLAETKESIKKDIRAKIMRLIPVISGWDTGLSSDKFAKRVEEFADKTEDEIDRLCGMY
jgi:hypothetical protein